MADRAVARAPIERPSRATPGPPTEPPRPEGPVWLMRILLLLFFAAFAVFLAREVEGIVRALGR